MLDLNAELNPRLLGCLCCPVCGAPLGVDGNGRSLVCNGGRSERNPKGKVHLFDGGAGGYVHLAPGHGGGGDAKEAVHARSAFLRSGYYTPAAEAIAALVRELTPKNGLVLDAGCGEGYYSGRIAEEGFPVLGVDLSKFAADTAAKTARRARMNCGQASSTLYAVGSVFELPVADETFDTVTNIFAPCAPAEYARVLKPGGRLIVAGAGERHLFGLKELIYDDPYLNDPRRDLPAEDDGLRLLEVRNVTFTITVHDPDHRAALFSMTPYYWRTSREGHSRLAAADTLTTEVSFDLHIYEKA
ncbi:MAG: methyltransferase domain-containing protein [Clostridia bacterium]|nr:methyltransferase domain-containing protein [Clostridia bacterium]